MQHLTQRQYEIISFIADYFRKKMQFPSFRTLGSHFKIRSTNAVACHLDALAKKGWITRDYYHSRGSSLTKEAREQLGLLFEFELREMAEDELYRRMAEPIKDGSRYKKHNKSVHYSGPKFGMCSSLPIDR